VVVVEDFDGRLTELKQPRANAPADVDTRRLSVEHQPELRRHRVDDKGRSTLEVGIAGELDVEFPPSSATRASESSFGSSSDVNSQSRNTD